MLDKLKLLALSVLAVFAPVKSVILMTGVMIFADLITGMMASHKRGEPITSAALRRTAIKAFVYEAAIMLGFLTETYFTGTSVPVSKIISSFIGLAELKSVLENLDSISGGSLLAVLINKLGSDNDKKVE